MLKINDKVIVVKGNRVSGITKGTLATCKEITLLGADYSHFVKVVLWMHTTGKTISFTARHINRLSDPVIRLTLPWERGKIEVRIKK